MTKKKPQYRNLLVSFLIATAIVSFSMAYGEGMSAAILYKKLLVPIFRLLCFVTLGLVVGQTIESTGWTEHLSIVARPFFRFSNLGNRCSAAFTAAFISGVISNAMLLDFYQEKKISKLQLFLTNYMNQLPAFFLHLPTTFFIVIPLTGTAGAFYFMLTFAATLLRTLCVLLFGHFYPPLKKNPEYESLNIKGNEKENRKENEKGNEKENGKGNEKKNEKENGKENEKGNEKKRKKRNDKKNQTLFESIQSGLPARIVNITLYVLPIYTLVFVLNHNGFFRYLNETLSAHLTLKFMPVESLSVVMLSFAAEFTSGFAAAGALMQAGILTTKQTVIALLLGNITAFPIRALRHQLPRYMGIFSPKMGLQLLLSGQVFRVLSIIVVGVVYYFVA